MCVCFSCYTANCLINVFVVVALKTTARYRSAFLGNWHFRTWCIPRRFLWHHCGKLETFVAFFTLVNSQMHAEQCMPVVWVDLSLLFQRANSLKPGVFVVSAKSRDKIGLVTYWGHFDGDWLWLDCRLRADFALRYGLYGAIEANTVWRHDFNVHWGWKGEFENIYDSY